MSQTFFESDGVLIRELIIDDGVWHSRLHQPGRDFVLNQNAEMRKNHGCVRKLESMGLELNIPDLDWIMLQKKYPDLNAPHGLTRSLAWKKFMGTSEADIYRVR